MLVTWPFASCLWMHKGRVSYRLAAHQHLTSCPLVMHHDSRPAIGAPSSHILSLQRHHSPALQSNSPGNSSRKFGCMDSDIGATMPVFSKTCLGILISEVGEALNGRSANNRAAVTVSVDPFGMDGSITCT